MVKFLTFGETMGQYNADFVGAYGDDGTYMLDCAGAESNVAVGLQKLGIPGVEAVWVAGWETTKPVNSFSKNYYGTLPSWLGNTRVR